MTEQNGIDFIRIRVDDSSPSEETPLINHKRSISDISIRSGIQAINPLPGMAIRSHKLEKGGGISECTVQEALQGAKTGKRHYWIDIDADHRDANELRAWLRNMKLPNFLIDVLSEPPEEWASQVLPLRRAALAVIRILPENPASDEVAHLAALSMNHLLLTFTSCPRSETGGLYAPAMEQMKQRERLPAPTSSGALLAWLRFHVERTSRCTRELRYAVLAMDEAMDRNIHNVSLQEIIDAKDQFLRLFAVAEEQSECLESLAGAELDADGLDFSPIRGSLSILLATAGATERMALRLEKHISDLRQRHEDSKHHQMDRRLAVLTVLSAIFLPLTLLTGIWGMNFAEMPELTKHDAYPIALLFMVSLAVIMVCFFKRAGWFD